MVEVNIQVNIMHGHSLIQIALGAIMLTIGMKYLPPSIEGDSTAATLSEDSVTPPPEIDPCPNGAAYYLYIAGIVLLVSNLIRVVFVVAHYLALWDGKISSGEECCLRIINSCYNVVVIADLVILIWGSVVVFTAWATWTDDYEEYAADVKDKNYCAYEPMMYAFVILIAKWALLPFLVVLFCFCSCLCGCCCT